MRLLELTEGYWKNVDIERQERPAPTPKLSTTKFHVLVNGRVWKKNGSPVEFTSPESAQRAADTIRNRYQKATQIVPAR